ncbi:MAG: hypothetical protein II594_05015, partial [Clostridium sp.]|nr:hypothetical protein [Clostridium sp.]
ESAEQGESAGETDAAQETEAEEFSEPEETIGPPRIEIDVLEKTTDYRDENDGHVLVHLTNTELVPGGNEAAAYPALADRMKSISRDDLTYKQDVLKKTIKSCMDEYAAHSETFTTMQVGIDVIMGRTDEEIVSFMKKEYSDLDGESPFWTYQGMSIDPKSGSSIKLSSIVTDQELLPDLLAEELRSKEPEVYERLCPPPPETEPETTAAEETKEDSEESAGDDTEASAAEETAESEPETEPAPDPAVVKTIRDCLKRYSGNGESLWCLTPEGLRFYFGPYALGAGSGEQILTIRQEDHPELFTLSIVNYPEITARTRTSERIFPLENVSVTGAYTAFDVDETKYPGLAAALKTYEEEAAARVNEKLDAWEKEAGNITDETVFKRDFRIVAQDVTADINTLTFDEVILSTDETSEEAKEEGRSTLTWDIKTGRSKKE